VCHIFVFWPSSRRVCSLGRSYSPSPCLDEGFLAAPALGVLTVTSEFLVSSLPLCHHVSPRTGSMVRLVMLLMECVRLVDELVWR